MTLGGVLLLFKKKKAPSFEPPQPTQAPYRQPPQNPSQGIAKPAPTKQPTPISDEQLLQLQQFLQHSYQSVTDYEYLIEKVPTEQTASTIRDIIDDHKKHYQTLLHIYRSQANKDPEIREASLNRNAYTPALKKAFEQSQFQSHLLEEATRYTENPQIRDIYSSIARDHQRHALWFLSYLTVFSKDDTKNRS